MALYNSGSPAAIDFGAELGLKKYNLTQNGEIQFGSFSAKTSTLNRWAINKKKRENNGATTLELFTLDSGFVGEVNEVFKSSEAVNQVFKQIYNELEVRVNKLGELDAVLNQSALQEKWKKLRREMVNVNNKHIPFDEILKLNDNIFDNGQLLHNVIKVNEFFSVFCNCIYGRSFPADVGLKKRNLLSSGEVQFVYSTTVVDNDNDHYKINITGIPELLSEKRKMELYSQYKFLEPYFKSLKPVHIYNASYLVDRKTGWILKATIRAEEIVHPALLLSSMDYVLEIDNS
jgi:hypothetical protein